MDDKKIKKAQALKYDPSKDNAPRIIATGRGQLAEKMIEKAKEENIPIYKDEHLAEALNKLEVGTEIPRELYEVVAEVLSFISRVDEQYGNK